MKVRKYVVIIVMLAITAILSISCSNPKTKTEDLSEPKKKVIGVSALTFQLEYYSEYAQSIKKSANRNGIKIMVTDSMWNIDKQISDIEGFINNKVDAIICSPVEPNEIKPFLIKAEEAGIPVVVEMTKVDGINPLVCTDQEAGGELAGKYVGEWINYRYGGYCDVAIIDFPYFQNTIDRVKGFKKGLAETAPHARIVASIDGKAKLETAMKAMEDILQKYPHVRCVFGINDDSAKGANAAYEGTIIPPEDVCIIGFDADLGTKKMINAHRYIKGSVYADTEKIAEACINAALNKIRGEKNTQNWINVIGAQFLITQENISKYYKPEDSGLIN
ncbi:substrate-binding domain-containing protein [Desulfosporosinus sp. BICA1-9]|uniref:substrate-binding domain-containing protein n=1 Tax=Desulfosporosinus sp. BICA1-9 TaxID=1531958 RepID=UPI00054C2323|nr:substrate-binding domain-containing protein [Desulfosporosinus sp. BICA1-9]KJS50554.1 MAG: hypothetical protein VR66_02000 [Peptococcaceae bacterium BRH_c23]KJS82820.1 MAG: hypothetical protein JL57_23645 [Desulfosporosinus sp. BICA1-9]